MFGKGRSLTLVCYHNESQELQKWKTVLMFYFSISSLQIHTRDSKAETAILYVKMLKELVALIAEGNKALRSVFLFGF